MDKILVFYFCLVFNFVCYSYAFILDDSPNSYAQFRKWGGGYNGSLEFEFKTEQPNGLLLYTDDGGTYDFFEIKLVEGALRLRYNLGGGAQIITVGRDLSDGHWHKVSVQRQVEHTLLTVDGITQSKTSRGKEFQFGRFLTNSDVFIGGMPALYNNKLTLLALPSVIFEPRFVGSVRNLVYADQEYGIPRRQEMRHKEGRGTTINDNQLSTVSMRTSGGPDACEAHDPCLHGGICISTDSGPICECRNVEYEGTFCEKGVFAHYQENPHIHFSLYDGDFMEFITLIFFADVALMTLHKLFGHFIGIPEDEMYLTKVSWPMIIIYIITFIPTGYIFRYKKSHNTRNFEDILFIDGLRLARTIRIFHYFYLQHQRIVQYNRLLIYTQLLFVLYMLTMFFTITHYIIKTHENRNWDVEDNPFHEEGHAELFKLSNLSYIYLVNLYDGVALTLNQMSFIRSLEQSDYLILISNILYGIIYGYLFGSLCIMTKRVLKSSFYFRNEMKRIRHLGKLIRIDDKLINAIQLSYFQIWLYNGSKVFNHDVSNHIPYGLQNDIDFDLACNLFHHSQMFRKTDVGFLRYLTQYIEFVSYNPDEIIYENGKYKNSLIYIYKGIVDLQSAEDGQTTVLSLSAGTVIGETSLLIATQSNTSIVSRTFCELQILKRSHFLKAMMLYPKIFKQFQFKLKDRLKMAKKYHQEIDRLVADPDIRANDILRMIQYYHYLEMDNQEQDIPNELFRVPQDIAKSSQAMVLEIEKINRLMFIATNIDSFVITEEKELITETFLIRTTFPWVLSHDSIIIHTWHHFIFAVILFTIPWFPYITVRKLTERTSPFSRNHHIENFIGIVYLIDVFVEISTAVRHNGTLITNIKNIILIHLQRWDFYIDILAAVPLYAIYFYWFQIHKNPYALAFFRILKFIKMLKIEFYIKDRKLMYPFLIGCIRWFCVMYILVYCFSTLFKIEGSIEQIYYPHLDENASIFFASLQIITLLLFHDYYTTPTILILVIILKLMVYMFHLCIYSWISAAFVLDRQSRSRYGFEYIIDYVSEINRYTEYDLKLRSRVINCLTVHEHVANLHPYYSIGYHQFRQFPNRMLWRINYLKYLPLLKRLPLFESFDENSLKRLSRKIKLLHLASREVVCYSGTLYDKLYVILRGYCTQAFKLMDGECHWRNLNIGDAINDFEFAIRIPTLTTVYTLTDCILLELTYHDFLTFYTHYPEEFACLQTAVNDMRVEWFRSNLFCKIDSNIGFTEFKIHLQTDSQYFEPENELEVWKKHAGPAILFRPLMLHKTIRMNSLFLHIWEIFRSLCALITAFLVMAPTLHEKSDIHMWDLHILLFVLDIAAYVDIFLRFHIQFYSKDGVIIHHRYYTGRNYLSHAFVVDLLGVLPFNILAPHLWIYWVNRLLQMYRFILSLNYFVWHRKEALTGVKYISIVTVMLVSVVTLDSLYVNHYCHFHSSIKASLNYTAGVYCKPESWVSYSVKKLKPLTPLETYCYGILFTLSMFSLSGIGNIIIATNFTLYYTLAIMLLGFFYIKNVHAMILYSRQMNLNKILYKFNMKTALRFISDRRIKSSTRHRIINHVEYSWKNKFKEDPSSIFSKFPTTIRDDVLLAIYGKVFEENTIFKHAGVPFIRSLLRQMSVTNIRINGNICRIHDIVDCVYVVYAGKVNVYDPLRRIKSKMTYEKSRIHVLKIGSIFGNLSKNAHDRCTIKYEARGHVKLLQISTESFQKLLEYYPDFYAFFQMHRVKNRFFIEGYQKADSSSSSDSDLHYKHRKCHRKTPLFRFNLTSIMSDEIVIGEHQSLFQRYLEHYRTFIRDYVVNRFFEHVELRNRLNKIHLFKTGILPTNPWLLIWEYFDIIFLCYTVCLLNMFQIIIYYDPLTYHITFVINLIYLFKMYLNCYCAYEVEHHGAIIVDIRLIIIHYINSVEFQMDVVSLIPFHWIPQMFVDEHMVNHHYFAWLILNLVCRLNLFLRFYHIRRFVNAKLDRLNVRLMYQHFFMLTMYMIFLSHFFATILLSINCMVDPNRTFNQQKCILVADSGRERYYIYYKSYILIWRMYTTGMVRQLQPLTIVHMLYIGIFIIIRQFLFIIYLSEWFICQATRGLKGQRYEQLIFDSNSYYNQKQISTAMSETHHDYMERLWLRERGTHYPRILRDMPNYLRDALKDEMYGRHIKNSRIFKNCHPDFLRQLIAFLEPQFYYPGLYVTFEGYIDNCMYFIDRGAVAIEKPFDPLVGVSEKLVSGDSFGARQGLFENLPHEAGYKVIKDSVILILKRNRWDYLLNFFVSARTEIYANIDLYT